MEPLILTTGFYYLPMAILLLVPASYSLSVLSIECLLWVRLLLMSIGYALH